jgi:hypothetical protein
MRRKIAVAATRTDVMPTVNRYRYIITSHDRAAAPRFELVQRIVQAIANVGLATGRTHVGNELPLYRADSALGMHFDFQRVKLSVMQQDQVSNSRLNT